VKVEDKPEDTPETKAIKIKQLVTDITRLLHSIGTVTWYDTPRLRDLVVINPQWLADALSSVVSFLSYSSIAKKGGMITWHTLKSSLKLK